MLVYKVNFGWFGKLKRHQPSALERKKKKLRRKRERQREGDQGNEAKDEKNEERSFSIRFIVNARSPELLPTYLFCNIDCELLGLGMNHRLEYFSLAFSYPFFDVQFLLFLSISTFFTCSTKFTWSLRLHYNFIFIFFSVLYEKKLPPSTLEWLLFMKNGCKER